VQTDGKILLGVTLEELGRGGSFRIGLARFNTDGSLDQTLGSGGTVIADSIHGCTALAELSDGDILAVNSSLIAQFTPTGVLESTVTGGSPAVKSADIFQSNGKYILAQVTFVGAPRGRDEDTQVFRFTATGNVDSTFNSPIFDFVGEGGSGHFDMPRAAALQANSQVVVVGSHSQTLSTTLNALARLNTNGSLDSTFGSGGIVTNDLPAQTDLALSLSSLMARFWPSGPRTPGRICSSSAISRNRVLRFRRSPIGRGRASPRLGISNNQDDETSGSS